MLLFLSLLFKQNLIENHPDSNLIMGFQLVAMSAIPLGIVTIVSPGGTVPVLAL